MPIVKVTDYLSEYRTRARARDINEMTGRTGRPDLTDWVTDRIVGRLPLQPAGVVVDVGCGDGTLLRKCADGGVDPLSGRLIGVLPSVDEAVRVRGHLTGAGVPRAGTGDDRRVGAHQHISIVTGLLTSIPLPDEYADITITNSTMHYLEERERGEAALAELYRITKRGGTVYVGEVLERDESAGRDYGDSIVRWLLHVWKHDGFGAFLNRLGRVIRGAFGRDPFIISPKRVFWISPEEFHSVAEGLGFSVVSAERHREIEEDGTEVDHPSRWDYVLRK